MDMFDTLTPNLKSLIGTRIRLIKMNDPFPVPSGTLGTIDHIDDMNNIHVKWENGSTLSLIYGEDQFEILEEEDGN
jgi:hypothetical protein